MAFFEDEARHNANLRFVGSNNTGTVRTYQTGIAALNIFLYHNHILCRDTFGNTNNNFDTSFGCFHYRVCRKSRGYKYDGYVSACFSNRVGNGVKYRPVKVLLTAFARRYPTYNLRSVLNHLRSVE